MEQSGRLDSRVIWDGETIKKMDLSTIEQVLDQGRLISVTYEYPSTERDTATGSIYRRRTDRLLDVCPERRRLFVAYAGTTPIWIEDYEVIEIQDQPPSVC